jgi:BlaI family transcriptional regulator, penicillinase repressor
MPSETKHHRLGDLQLTILRILWQGGEAPVAEIHEKINRERKLAYTTVATMLRKMESRGLVHHREEGRAFLYLPLVSSDEVSRSIGDHFVQRLFEGSLTSAVSHLLQTHEVSPSELDELAKLIQDAKRRAK